MEKREPGPELIHSLFEHMSEGIVVSDYAGEIVMVNPSAERMFGYTSDELRGKGIDILVPASVRQHHSKNREEFIQHPRSRPMGLGLNLYASRKDGTEFPVEISLSPFQHDQERYIIAFIIDITVRKEIEASVMEKQTELERVASVLMATNEELEKKVSDRTMILQEAITELEKSRNELTKALDKEKDLNDLKSRFISMASHEFRTPLTTILSSASLIAEYNSPGQEEKKLKHVTRIKAAVNNLNDILSDFLSISKMEEGKVYPEGQLFNLVDLSNEVINDLQITAKPGQKIAYGHEGPPVVYLDIKLYRNILINLVSNAIKFSTENKPITIKTWKNEQETGLEIADEGLGISDDDQKHLFERFYRGKNVTNIQGTGLGLHIVANYIDLMKGRMSLKSKLNVGTTIRIEFPNQNI